MKSPSSQWYAWAQDRLAAGGFGDRILLSFEDEAEYATFNKYNRTRYTIEHTLVDHQSGRFHVWVTKR